VLGAEFQGNVSRHWGKGCEERLIGEFEESSVCTKQQHPDSFQNLNKNFVVDLPEQIIEVETEDDLEMSNETLADAGLETTKNPIQNP